MNRLLFKRNLNLFRSPPYYIIMCSIRVFSTTDCVLNCVLNEKDLNNALWSILTNIVCSMTVCSMTVVYILYRPLSLTTQFSTSCIIWYIMHCVLNCVFNDSGLYDAIVLWIVCSNTMTGSIMHCVLICVFNDRFSL